MLALFIETAGGGTGVALSTGDALRSMLGILTEPGGGIGVIVLGGGKTVPLVSKLEAQRSNSTY